MLKEAWLTLLAETAAKTSSETTLSARAWQIVSASSMGQSGHEPVPVHQECSRRHALHVFNHGKHTSDFTYIDDIVEGVIRSHPGSAC